MAAPAALGRLFQQQHAVDTDSSLPSSPPTKPKEALYSNPTYSDHSHHPVEGAQSPHPHSSSAGPSSTPPLLAPPLVGTGSSFTGPSRDRAVMDVDALLQAVAGAARQIQKKREQQEQQAGAQSHPLLRALLESCESAAAGSAAQQQLQARVDSAIPAAAAVCALPPALSDTEQQQQQQQLPTLPEGLERVLSSQPRLHPGGSGIPGRGLDRMDSGASARTAATAVASVLDMQQQAAPPRISSSAALQAALAAAADAANSCHRSPQRQSSRTWANAQGGVSTGADTAAVPLHAASGAEGAAVSSAPNLLTSISNLAAVAGRAESMCSLLERMKQLRAKQAESAAGPDPAAAPAASAGDVSGMSGDPDSNIIRTLAGLTNLPGYSGLTSGLTSAGSGLTGSAVGGTIDAPLLKQLLSDVVNSKKQAAVCIREAVALGLLPDFVLKPLLSMPAASGGEAAAGSNKRQREAAAAAAGTDGMAGVDEPPRKLHRLATGSVGSGMDAAAAGGVAISRLQRNALLEAAAAAADGGGDASRQLLRHLSTCSTASEAATTHIALLGSSNWGTPPPPAVATDKGLQQQQQQQVPDKTCESNAGIEAAAAAAGAAEQTDLMTPKAHKLFLRTVMVMSQSQRLCRQLTAALVNSMKGVQARRQSDAQHAAQAQAAAEQAQLCTMQQLQQQLAVTKVSLAMKQQALLQLQQESQQASASHTLQLQGISNAVQELLDVVNSEGLGANEKKKLASIASAILRAALQQK